VAQTGNASLWSITFYDDTSNTHNQWATQNICFIQTGVQGSNVVGIWYSTTYQRWIGTWRQEGDQVFMIGNFWTDRGNDSMQWEITVGTQVGFGDWEEWIDNTAFGNWFGKGNSRFIYQTKCPWQVPLSATGGLISGAELRQQVINQSLQAPLRVRADGVAPSPTDPLQVPLK
jgi:hypothetical protein